jgi:hypothetical protein
MRGRLVIVALFAVALGSIGVSVGASAHVAVPEATCSLPGTVPCLTDSECVAYGAICDVQSGACVCAAGDLGSDLGGDLGAADLAGTDLGSDGGGGAGGSSGVGGFLGGGGQTGPPKSGSGCSFAPGSAPLSR